MILKLWNQKKKHLHIYSTFRDALKITRTTLLYFQIMQFYIALTKRFERNNNNKNNYPVKHTKHSLKQFAVEHQWRVAHFYLSVYHG